MSPRPLSDGLEQRLLAIQRSHRRNEVVEPHPDEPHPDELARTRVRCDGNACTFFEVRDTWYAAVAAHEAHLAAVLAAALHDGPEPTVPPTVPPTETPPGIHPGALPDLLLPTDEAPAQPGTTCCHGESVVNSSVPDPQGALRLADRFSETVSLRIAVPQPQHGLVQLNATRSACGCLVSCDVDRDKFLAAVAQVLQVTITPAPAPAAPSSGRDEQREHPREA